MTNKEIAAAFVEMGTSLRMLGEPNKFRVEAYFKAADRIARMDKEMAPILDAGEPYFAAYLLRNPGIGESSRAKIYSLIVTGSCKELREMRALMTERGLVYDPNPQPPAAVEGEPSKRKASKNLRKEVTEVRRPWADADIVVQALMPTITAVFHQAECCGSYRRHKDTVKDIDFVVSKKFEGQTVEQCFDVLLAALQIEPSNVIKKGEAQCSFYITSPSGEWQVDLWYVEPSSWGSAILFATGSGDFNKEMRGRIKARGFKLNRYGLFKVIDPDDPEKDELLASATEEAIFKVLGYAWLPPAERSDFSKVQPYVEPAVAP
jgi:DNA polymerase (family 10)